MNNQDITQNNPMDINSIMAAIEKNKQQTGQRIASQASIYDQYNPSTDMTISSLQKNHADKVKQLFDHDTQLAQTYFQPEAAPAAPGETVAQPTQRVIDPTIGMRAASTQNQATANEAEDIITQIAQRKDYLGNERDKALSMIDKLLGLNDREAKSLQDQLSTALGERDRKTKNTMDILNVTGGTISPEMAKLLGNPDLAGTKIPSEAERAAAQRQPSESEKQNASSVERLKSDIASGGHFDELAVRYSGELPLSQIRQEYNKGPMAKKWGQAKETDADIMGRISGAKKGQNAKDMAKQQAADDGLKQSIAIINRMNDSYKKMGEFEKHLPKDWAEKYKFLAPNRNALNTDYFIGLAGELRKAVIGGRITQTELRWIQDALMPTATDFGDSYQKRVDEATWALQLKLKDPNADISNISKLKPQGDNILNNAGQGAGGQQGGGGSKGGTTRMTSPDGTHYDVPNAKVGKFKQQGYK